jgi:hypothetical protein
MSLQRMAAGSRANGSSCGFGTMCAYGNATLSRADATHNAEVHKCMVVASLKGDWDTYTQLQAKLK